MEGNNSATVIYLSCSYHSVLLLLYTVVVPRVCVSVRSFLHPRASRLRNIGTYVFTATRKTLVYIIIIFAENASFRSYGIICLCH